MNDCCKQTGFRQFVLGVKFTVLCIDTFVLSLKIATGACLHSKSMLLCRVKGVVSFLLEISKFIDL